MANTGEKIGPGPAKYNMNLNAYGSVFEGSNVSLKSSFAQCKRVLGEPNSSVKYAAKPGQYERHDIKDGMKMKELQGLFPKQERNVDFIMHNQGMEEFTLKGLQ